MTKIIILVVYEHPSWGSVFSPYIAIQDLQGNFTLEEIANSSSVRGMAVDERVAKIIAYGECYTDQALMKKFSKEKTLKQFLSKVSDEIIFRYIRPCIESYHRKILQLVISSGIFVLHRTDLRSRTINLNQIISVTDSPATATFTFTKEKELKYSVRITAPSGNIDLYSANYLLLSQNPAIIVANKILYFFNDIDVKKLVPFFSKKEISIPADIENQYLKTFVKSSILKYDIEHSGLNISKIEPNKIAQLSFEEDWYGKPVLLLSFIYENQKYSVDHTNRKVVIVEEANEGVSLKWYYTDKQWETSIINLLLNNGLSQTGLNHFSISGEEESADKVYTLINWICINKKLLSAFDFRQNFHNRTYFLGDISIDSNIETGNDWFDLKCIVILGDFTIPFVNFRHHILNNIRDYKLPDGSIATLPAEWFQEYYDLMYFGKKSGDSLRISKCQFKLADKFRKGKDEETFKTLTFSTNHTFAAIPEKLSATLRPYQIIGFQWLVWLYDNKLGGCLADDMGLGKTLQVLTLLLYVHEKLKHRPGNGDLMINPLPSLIIVPTSLLYNWQNEIQKFAPTLKFHVFSGVNRQKSSDPNLTFNKFDLVLTTYGTLRNDIEWFKNAKFHHLVMDESQYLKNPGSVTHKSVKQLDALYRISITGTPLENSLSDLWAQFNLLNDNMLGSFATFKEVYVNSINKSDKESKAKQESLLHIIRPFLLRRTKQEVAPELPDLYEETLFCDMSPTQAEVYEKEKNLIRNRLLDTSAQIAPGQFSIIALQGLTRLRILANHPAMLDPGYEGDSGKFEQICMNFETLRAEGHKVLIFSSFVKHLRILANFFDDQNWQYSCLTGSMTPAQRDAEITRFNNDSNINCFFISLKAGGTGLNLTAADYVFIIDPWWNPASETQALSRAHRIGQDKKVFVYRFITSNSIEDKIRKLQAEKSNLASTFITTGNPLSALSLDEIMVSLG